MKFPLLLSSAMMFGLAALIVPPLHADVGRPVEQIRVHTVGGTLADRSYSFAAVLTNDGHASCSATLVAAEWALTAAHCVVAAMPYQLGLRIGSPNIADGEAHTVSAIVPEPHDVDIALLRLDQAASASAIGIGSRPASGNPVRAIGFGQKCTSSDCAPMSTQLMQVELHKYPDRMCRQVDATYNRAIEMCVGDTAGEASCFGDSGGPVVAAGTTGEQPGGEQPGGEVLIGITSGGAADSCAEGLDMYVDVAAFAGWITSVTSGDPGLPAES